MTLTEKTEALGAKPDKDKLNNWPGIEPGPRI